MATHDQAQPFLSLPQRPVGEHDLGCGVLQKHGLQVYALGSGHWYAWCGRHACPSLVDSLDAALEAECPGCAAEREVELRRRSLVQSVEYQRLAFRLRVGSV